MLALAEFVPAPGVLAAYTLAAARALMDVVAGSGQPYAWTLHDYSPVCHRNHLVQPDGRYCGLAAVSECRGCLARDADGFLCEAAYEDGREDHLRGIHLTGRRAGEAATAAHVRRLLLTLLTLLTRLLPTARAALAAGAALATGATPFAPGRALLHRRRRRDRTRRGRGRRPRCRTRRTRR